MTKYPTSVAVSSKKQEALLKKMAVLGVREEDFEEQFIRSSGKGGQNVNKTATCVVLRHRPTGTLVRCETERSQALNRFLARRRLVEKIETARLGKQSEAQAKLSKLHRQKRRRSRRAKQKILAAKRHQGEKKQLRRKSISGQDV